MKMKFNLYLILAVFTTISIAVHIGGLKTAFADYLPFNTVVCSPATNATFTNCLNTVISANDGVRSTLTADNNGSITGGTFVLSDFSYNLSTSSGITNIVVRVDTNTTDCEANPCGYINLLFQHPTLGTYTWSIDQEELQSGNRSYIINVDNPFSDFSPPPFGQYDLNDYNELDLSVVFRSPSNKSFTSSVDAIGVELASSSGVLTFGGFITEEVLPDCNNFDFICEATISIKNTGDYLISLLENKAPFGYIIHVFQSDISSATTNASPSAITIPIEHTNSYVSNIIPNSVQWNNENSIASIVGNIVKTAIGVLVWGILIFYFVNVARRL